jgi:hypothetical protein
MAQNEKKKEEEAEEQKKLKKKKTLCNTYSPQYFSLGEQDFHRTSFSFC